MDLLLQKTTILILTTMITLMISILTHVSPSDQTNRCRTTCGGIQISYPFGIDDGCGSPYYRHLLTCSQFTKPESQILHLRTPSGRYPLRSISYSPSSDRPHMVLLNPSAWSCPDSDRFRPRPRPFTLDSSTRLSLSMKNDYLFFNCSSSDVIVGPRPAFCERFPDKCDSVCDSGSYLCRHLPECGESPAAGKCCSYSPKATDSLRLMLGVCDTYASVYWRNTGDTQPYDQVAEYGIRVDFDIPVTTRCLECQDMNKGGGTCGYDVHSQEFLCLCGRGNNVTTFCNDHNVTRHRNVGVIAGTASAVSAGGVLGIVAGIWYFKVRAKAPVTCGVQTNENRLF